MVQCGESRPVVAYVTFHTHEMIIYSIGNVCGAVNVVRTWFDQLTWQPLWSKLIQPSQVMGEGPAVCSLQVWSIDYAYRIAVVSSVLIIDCWSTIATCCVLDLSGLGIYPSFAYCVWTCLASTYMVTTCHPAGFEGGITMETSQLAYGEGAIVGLSRSG